MPNIKTNFLCHLARHPRLLANAVRNAAEARRGALHRRADPLMLQLEVTSKCNFQCTYCIVHNGTGSDAHRHMEMATYRHLLDRFPKSAYLHLQGQGEPLLHPQLVEMVRLAKVQHRYCSVVSNGSLWDEAASRALLAAGIDVITFSLDLCEPEEMERLRRGMKVDQVVANLRRLLRLRDRLRPRTAVGCSAVLLRHVHDDPAALRKAVGWLDGLGIDFLMVDPLAGTESYRSRYTAPLLTERLDTLDPRRPIPVPTRCTIYNAPQMNTFAGRCIWPWLAVYINYDGTIVRCANTHRITVGHADDPEPLDLPAHVALRRDFTAGRVPEGCEGCQYLFGCRP